MAVAGKSIHQAVNYMAAQHVVEGGTSGRADQNGIDAELLCRCSDRLRCVMRDCPYGYDFNMFFAHLPEGMGQSSNSLFIGQVRRAPVEKSRPLFHIDAIYRRLPFAFGARDSLLNETGVFSSNR